MPALHYFRWVSRCRQFDLDLGSRPLGFREKSSGDIRKLRDATGPIMPSVQTFAELRLQIDPISELARLKPRLGLLVCVCRNYFVGQIPIRDVHKTSELHVITGI